MKVYVAGATGRVARELIKDLVAAGHDVIAAARVPAKIDIDPAIADHVSTVAMDLHASVSVLASTFGANDEIAQAVYFVAGSRGKDLLQTDAFGAIKLMKAAESRGIQRFIMLSSIYSLEPDKWESDDMASLRNYITAKFFADHYLVSDTHLDYTILQPTSLTEEAGTGAIALGTEGAMTNPIPDVAGTLAALLDHPGTIKKVIRMGSGTTPIDEALQQV
jgi:nucleoside-diphosphate-sugar epimerase